MSIKEMPCPVCELNCERLAIIPYDRETPFGKRADGNQLIGDDAHFYSCRQCGQYIVLEFEESDNLTLSPGQRSRKHPGHKLSCMLRERFIRQQTPTFIQFHGGGRQYEPLAMSKGYTTCHINELLASFPRDAVEKIDRALLNLAAMVGDRPGGQLKLYLQNDKSIFFEPDEDDVHYLLNALADAPNRFIQYAPMSDGGRMLNITPTGWRRVRELTRSTGSKEEPVFVAMAFGRHGTAQETIFTWLFKNAFKKAVEHCGFEAKRADSEPHSDYIMNKVIGDIRAAPFVVADFTRHRKGVYFEAGFARGLGKHVIHCCKRTEFRRAHFDTSQISHILWSDEADLYRQLRQAIRAAIGTGPYKDLMKDAPEE